MIAIRVLTSPASGVAAFVAAAPARAE